ncbi:formate dehydrogenase accessory sulfurtransferase FdhD [Eubacteriaceae bacterium ES3]|nr:formate dehydrogenase accessory sulfurtransferase FdhD [Eubacteriaceae bacterium ES3]
MRIINEAEKLELVNIHHVKRITKEKDGFKTVSIEDQVIEEHHMNVFINEQLAFNMVCTPQNLEHLVLGFLFSQGYIKSIEEIEYIYICELGERVKVQMKEKIDLREMMHISKSDATACGNNNIMLEVGRKQKIKKVSKIRVEPDFIFLLSDACNRQAELFKETGGTHSCSMMTGNREVLFCEDIGRHNAIDKLIGKALIEGIDLSKCIIFSSGRIPLDMVFKVIRGGIPVIASHSAPTGKAVELAKEYDLTLIGFVRGKRMNLYTD